MATATALETAMETAKVTAGDVGGGGGNTAIAATATAMAGVEVGGGDDVNPFRYASTGVLWFVPSRDECYRFKKNEPRDQLVSPTK